MIEDVLKSLEQRHPGVIGVLQAIERGGLMGQGTLIMVAPEFVDYSRYEDVKRSRLTKALLDAGLICDSGQKLALHSIRVELTAFGKQVLGEKGSR